MGVSGPSWKGQLLDRVRSRGRGAGGGEVDWIFTFLGGRFRISTLNSKDGRTLTIFGLPLLGGPMPIDMA
jgi:hypothetical protein